MVSCILKSWIAAVMTSNHCLSLCTVLDVLKFRNRDSSIETSLCSFLCITVMASICPVNGGQKHWKEY